MLEAKGRTGRITFDGSVVTLYREGLRARILTGGGSKQIPVGAISAVQFKRATIFVGYIHLNFSGAIQRPSRFGRNSSDASRDENAVIFGRRSNVAFEQIADSINAAVAAARNAHQATSSAASVPDQIRQLADLHAQMLISDAEFEAKRRELLDRM